ncbi:MAG TPA: hypothetical protein PLD59_11570 [Tepidisphaeraceae bacterium]|nr:hypothetical protein [Tepidisphaeraceae bacterium]
MTSPTVVLNAHFDGKVIIADEPVALAPNQRIRVTVEPIDSCSSFAPHPDSTADLAAGDPLTERDITHVNLLDAVPPGFVRKPGSGAGEIVMSDDFNETPAGLEDYK